MPVQRDEEGKGGWGTMGGEEQVGRILVDVASDAYICKERVGEQRRGYDRSALLSCLSPFLTWQASAVPRTPSP